ncbi:MAG: nucleoside triphosphate pyrophosphohydrolase, partial [Actinomycetota bacterium]|nr:nucleoside triphosphate pyrophosphohydrolase [Actinomycetota bacterium]
LLPDAVDVGVLLDAAALGRAAYAPIVEELVAAAIDHGEILYAVPGSPLVLERSVRALLADGRVRCRVLPALSFLDLAWARLGVDPVADGVRLVDASEMTTSGGPAASGPLLVAHVHDRQTFGGVRTVLAGSDDDAVVVLTLLGHADEAVVATTWRALAADDAFPADASTCLYVPAGATPADTGYRRFHRLVRTLREQCPWDRQQTHASLIPYLVEETFELVDALQALDDDDPASQRAVVEELGDVLFQVEFHATIAEQEGRFTIADVTGAVHDKLVRRHPHVFGDVRADDAVTVVANWDEIKRTEKSRSSVFDGVASSLPGLAYIGQLMRKAAKVGFDWPDVAGPLAKLDEELAELRTAVAGTGGDVTEELGDVLATVVSVARHLGVDAELAMRRAAGKFRRRFETVEALAAERRIDLRAADLAALDALWNEVKATEPTS